jgi:hypothetical protein
MVAFVQKENRPNPAAFQAIGEHLWSLFDRGDVGTYLASVWKANAKTNAHDVREGIRTILDVRDPELHALPWELMVRQNVPLFASPLNPVVRGLLEPAPTAPGSGVAAAYPDGRRIEAPRPRRYGRRGDREPRGRRPSLRREIDLRVEHPHSKPELSDLIKNFKPHVLHFTGHGGEVPRPGTRLSHRSSSTTSGGTRWDWTAAEVPATLAVGAPRLAFLNACRTGAGRDDGST